MSNDVNNFSSSMFARHFISTITKPTRFPCSSIQNGTPSLLDHIWTNGTLSYVSGILATDISDHCPTFVGLYLPAKINSKIKIMFRDHNSDFIENFRSKLFNESLFDDNLDSVSDQTEYFINKLDKFYCQCFPIRVKYVSYKRLEKPWISSGILKSIKSKSTYFKLNKFYYLI